MVCHIFLYTTLSLTEFVFLATGDDKDEKLALKVLCSLLGKKEGLMYLYEECKVIITITAIVLFYHVLYIICR